MDAAAPKHQDTDAVKRACDDQGDNRDGVGVPGSEKGQYGWRCSLDSRGAIRAVLDKFCHQFLSVSLADAAPLALHLDESCAVG